MVEKEKPKPSAVSSQESRSGGQIGLSMYKKYFGAGCGVLVFVVLIMLCIGTQILASGGDYFLSYW